MPNRERGPESDTLLKSDRTAGPDSTNPDERDTNLEYSLEVCRLLTDSFHQATLHRPMRVERYDQGTELTFDVKDVENGKVGKVRLLVDKFVGGGFAGQVYRVRIDEIENGPIGRLECGQFYALKIMVPPSRFSLLCRNIVYKIGFQGPFQLQTNPSAARAGALWQKFFRRAAGIRFGDSESVNDLHAILVDETLGSCGEIGDWIDGRTWRLEVDDRMDLLRRWRRGKGVEDGELGSPEYRSKHRFMHDFVDLLHEMGAHEFARQYLWTTWKSQPNCLKRVASDPDPCAGLVAVDFRAGLTVLPFLPMCPADFGIIIKGIFRGSIVQFDRGNISKLEQFVRAHSEDFEDMTDTLKELKAEEKIYRNSLVDITHNHVRLLYSRQLWKTILHKAIEGWKIRGYLDRAHEERFEGRTISTILFGLLGVVPLLGTVLRKIWGHSDWRNHYKGLLKSLDYWRRALRGKAAEKTIVWHRSGRLDATKSLRVGNSTGLFMVHSILSILPIGIYRLLTSWEYAKERLNYIFARPIRLYFNAELREEWLNDMVREGQDKHIVTDEDSEVILSQIKEPYIQKYLKSLAVHLCTVPVTQLVSLIVALIYVNTHPELPRAQAWAIGVGIIALFQVVPVSPGSLVRGLYVLYLVIRERNFRDYNIAVFLGFFKYVGYLAFPIQMTYRYPTIARFMATHWATEAVRIVPVFGEQGALLEHGVFNVFYNWPLTIRRHLQMRAEARAGMSPRYWHVSILSVLVALIFCAVDYSSVAADGSLPRLKELWWLTVLVPLLLGSCITLLAKGASLAKRVISAAIGGLGAAVLNTLALLLTSDLQVATSDLILLGVWRAFIFALLATIGGILTELRISRPAN